MKKIFGVLGVAVVLAFTVPAAASAAEKAAAKAPAVAPAAAPLPVVKAGDTVHVCACGPSCKCQSIQVGPGNCACGSPLVRSKVVSADKSKIVAQRDGQPEQTYTAAK
jgi:hypothetical protein